MESTRDSLTIHGWGNRPAFRETEVSGRNDHRVVMSLAIAATLGSAPVVIDGAEAIAKTILTFSTTCAASAAGRRCFHESKHTFSDRGAGADRRLLRAAADGAGRCTVDALDIAPAHWITPKKRASSPAAPNTPMSWSEMRTCDLRPVPTALLEWLRAQREHYVPAR